MEIQSKTFETGTSEHNTENASHAAISAFNGTKSSLTSEFYGVLADIEYLVKDMAQLAGDDLVRAGVEINEHIATARKAVDTMSETLADRAQQTVTATNDYIQSEPWKAIGISAAVGLVLGALMARRA